jgi:hypothetical protein
MGFLDKLLRGADKIHDAKMDAEDAIFRDRSFERAEHLAESGASHAAVITGIHGRYNDTTELVFRLEWNDGEPRAAAVLFGGNAPVTLRLGCAVLVATDGDSAVLDPAAMASAPTATTAPGRKHRRVPEPGIDDEAQDMRVLKQLKKWAPERGTVESWTRASVFGMQSDNWDIVLRRADGSSANVKRVEVPTYARWFVHPGAEVPIVVDPGDSTRAQVDWPKLAVERSGGSWQDEPPPGSIAADYLASPTGPAAEVTSIGGEVDLTVPDSSAEAVEGVTIEQLARVEAALGTARVPPKGYDDYATAEFGFPAGRYTEIVKLWNERMKGDWRLGAAFGEAVSATRRDMKKKR